MKCPLFCIGYLANPKATSEEDTECQKEECAWWVERVRPDTVAYKTCALVALADLLHGMVEKIPERRRG